MPSYPCITCANYVSINSPYCTMCRQSDFWCGSCSGTGWAMCYSCEATVDSDVTASDMTHEAEVVEVSNDLGSDFVPGNMSL